MNELIISLDNKLISPLYEQIYQYMKQEIQKQRLVAGERLPSSRALCRSLGVSRSTVDLAYEQLVSEGYIESVPCKGYYVCELEGIYHIMTEVPRHKKEQIQEQENYEYDFALNGIAPDGFPYHAWKKLSKMVLSQDDPALFQLGDPCGEESLREAIAGYLYHARGVHCEASQILVGAGNDYLLMVLSTIIGSKPVIAMENPTYISAYQAFSRLGYCLKAIDLDEKGMRMDELEQSGADVAYVMPSHQFPMGTVMPMKRRMELLGWAAGRDRYIVEDDYDSEFRYKGKPIPALQGFDKGDRVIYLGTFSKSIAPAIRISYMVLPKRLMEIYEQQGKAFSATVSKVDQKIIEHFLRDGYYERHLNRMRSVYRGKHEVLLSGIRELSSICSYSGENAGVHLLLHFTNGMSEEMAVERARRVGIKVYGLSGYYVENPKEATPSTILLGYAALTEDEIKSAMRRLKSVWD